MSYDRDPFDETVEIEIDEPVKQETQMALLVSIEGEDAWIPKSQISPYSEVNSEGDVGKLIVTAWIAQQKGLA